MKKLIAILFIFALFSCKEETVKPGLLLRKETRHFQYYCYPRDVVFINPLSRLLDASLIKISHDLHVPAMDKKIRVTIYSNSQTLCLDWTGRTNNPISRDTKWGGNAIYDRLNIVSPLIGTNHHFYKTSLSVAVHELTHVLIENIYWREKTPRVPRWLDEGIAVYEQNEWVKEHYAGFGSSEYKQDLKIFKNSMRTNILKGHVPAIVTLDFNFYGSNGYLYSFQIVKYMKKRYGMKKINQYLRKAFDFKGVFGISEDQFYKEWMEYLKKEFVN